MVRDRFTDRRGDEYSFAYYSTGELDVVKKKKRGGIFHVSYTEEAAERLAEFLDRARVRRDD